MSKTTLLRALLAGAIVLTSPASTLAESSTYTYDALGRVLTQTDADGTTVTFSYDPAGNRTQRVIAAGTAHRPTAVNDTLAATGSTPASIDPRTNDTDPNGDTLSVSGASTPGHGTTSFTASSVTYTANSGYTGSDVFSYTVTDTHSLSSKAYVNVNVSAPSSPTHVNPNPSWSNISFSTNQTHATGANAAQTIQGITTGITLQLSTSGTSGGGALAYSKNGGSWTTWTSGTTISVVNGNTLAFQVSIATPGEAIGTITVTNTSDSNTVIGQFTYDVAANGCIKNC